MKRTLLFLTVILRLANFAVADGDGTIQNGLRAKITVNVVDEDGNPIEGATVKNCFVVHGGSNTVAYQSTDKNGKATFEGLANTESVIRVTKDGHYASRHRYKFMDLPIGQLTERIKLGYWEAATIVLVLKKEECPVGVTEVNYSLTIPAGENDVVFMVDPVAQTIVKNPEDLPASNGVIKIVASCSAPEGEYLTPRLLRNSRIDFSLSVTNAGCGFIKLERDGDSDYELTKEAPKIGYVNAINYKYLKENDVVLERTMEYNPADYYVYKIPSGIESEYEYGLIKSLKWGREGRNGDFVIEIVGCHIPAGNGENVEMLCTKTIRMR